LSGISSFFGVLSNGSEDVFLEGFLKGSEEGLSVFLNGSVDGFTGFLNGVSVDFSRFLNGSSPDLSFFLNGSVDVFFLSSKKTSPGRLRSAFFLSK
jgi:hypothetical protein